MGDAGGRGLILWFALAAVVAVLAGCGGDSDSGDSNAAHVNEDTGSTHGLPADERTGTPPPPVKDTELFKIADKAGCYVFPRFTEQGHRHLPQNSPNPVWGGPALSADVPNSGDHVEPPYQQADGAYLLRPEPLNLLGSLAHGRMAIQYAPDLVDSVQLKLKGLYDTMYGGTLLFPNDAMRYAIAATTWRALLACTTWAEGETLDAIRAFGKTFWGKRGHDPVEAGSIVGPTPKDPAEPGAS